MSDISRLVNIQNIYRLIKAPIVILGVILFLKGLFSAKKDKSSLKSQPQPTRSVSDNSSPVRPSRPLEDLQGLVCATDSEIFGDSTYKYFFDDLVRSLKSLGVESSYKLESDDNGVNVEFKSNDKSYSFRYPYDGDLLDFSIFEHAKKIRNDLGIREDFMLSDQNDQVCYWAMISEEEAVLLNKNGWNFSVT